MKIVKAGNVELTEKDAQQIYEKHLYVCSYVGIYQPFYSQASNQYYFQKISNVKGIARRGRFYTLSAKDINNILGYEFLIED